ncbi:MAG: HAMP domain-containing histidine kinase [Dorea sp.]|nr:HAMP domain-containing histidine kinase [Dorea sp.]
MYVMQQKARSEELKRISIYLQDLLGGKEINIGAGSEETMSSKINYQLMRVQNVLVSQKTRAQNEKKELQELISEIAHQMRTPLTNLRNYLGFLEEIIEEKKSEPEKQYLKAIQISEEKIYFLTEHFIRISRLEHGIIQLKKEEKDFMKTLRNALGQVQEPAEKKKIIFQFEFPRKIEVKHDTNWIGEAIFNLLDNAVKYSNQGGKIKVTVQKDEIFLTLRIRDYGIGIEPGEENKIFQRFYRGSRVDNQEGFGIGLYLAREIVSKHGGILIGKRKNPGFEMRMSLPQE